MKEGLVIFDVLGLQSVKAFCGGVVDVTSHSIMGMLAEPLFGVILLEIGAR